MFGLLSEKLHNNPFIQQIIQSQRWSLVVHCHENGTVAQSVEQRTFNPLVASSNLARPTIFNRCKPSTWFKLFAHTPSTSGPNELSKVYTLFDSKSK